MARYYRRRYTRTVVRAPKKKWASNFRDVNMEVQNQTQLAADVYVTRDLAENKSETTSPTPVIIKTGNFKLQGDYYILNSGAPVDQYTVTGMLYIIYLPEGVSPVNPAGAQQLVTNHPEWILGWRVIDFSVTTLEQYQAQDVTKVSLTSRLKRNLNSGDKIVCLVLIQNMPSGCKFVSKGMCQFWTCAN